MSGSLKDKILQAKLTRKEGEIAEYILDNLYEVCFMTASDLAKRLNTSNTSVNRTAKALGYTVFADLQRELQSYVSRQATQVDSYTLSPPQRITRDTAAGAEDLYLRMANAYAAHLAQVVQKNTPDKVDAVVELLAGSRRRFVNGLRNSADLAGKFGFLLRLIVPNVVTCAAESVSSMELLMDAGPEDCVVVISFNRYYRAAREVMELCRERGTRIVLLTDRLTAPFASMADHLLIVEVQSLSFFNSNVAAMFLLEVLAAKLALRCGDEALERLHFLDPYIRTTQID